ncbi:MAG: diguanylate cyclase [Solirubrobacteraceae bacterium]
MRVRRKRALGLTGRFALVLAAFVLVLGGLGWAGLIGLSSARGSLDRLYEVNVTNQNVATSLTGHLDDAEQLILRGWVMPDPAGRAQLSAALNSHVLPQVDLGITKVGQLAADNPQQTKIAQDLTARWAAFRALWGGDQWGSGPYSRRSAHNGAVLGSLNALTADADRINNLENVAGAQEHRDAVANVLGSKHLMIAALIVGFLVSLAIVLWLTRTVLRRILAYSRFAGEIAEGDYGARLEPGGNDEIDRLGRTLDDVAERRSSAEVYDREQLEFSDSLQMMEQEREAQDLLRRHLQRSIMDSVVTVFNRNNSADRLEPVTPVASDSPLLAVLRGATPRDCLAVRAAAAHTETPEHERLLGCKLCTACPDSSTCTPLLVGGEVIGSVLINHEAPLDSNALQRIRESVGQAAPVIANLRNLAIAQLRASTDALTGLPNRRALDDMLKRMVAESHRNALPLAALMFDLDHFKRINDEFGHSKGDELLAAVGASLRHLMRADDFAARYGGEEFLVLLPGTDLDGALTIAEKIRRAIDNIELAGADLRLTVSIGAAVLPDHATDAERLQRAADRALYSAKTNGRDRVEVASGPAEVASGPAEVAAAQRAGIRCTSQNPEVDVNGSGLGGGLGSAALVEVERAG